MMRSMKKFRAPPRARAPQVSKRTGRGQWGKLSVPSRTRMLAAMVRRKPKNCTRQGSTPFLGASPMMKPVRHQLLPTSTMAKMPNRADWKKAVGMIS